MKNRDGDEEALLRFRASLGKWKHPDGRWTSILPCNEDHYFSSFAEKYSKFNVIEFVEVYKPYRKYFANKQETQNIMVKLRKTGFKLAEPHYTALSSVFKNGELVTGGTILRDFFEGKPQSNTASIDTSEIDKMFDDIFLDN